jgi:hypothetical protein
LPRDSAGVIQLIEVGDITTTSVQGTPFIVTDAPSANPEPVIVITVPPDPGETDGENPSTLTRALACEAFIIEVEIEKKPQLRAIVSE